MNHNMYVIFINSFLWSETLNGLLWITQNDIKGKLGDGPGNSHSGKTSHFLGFLSLLRGRRGKNLAKASEGLQGTQLGLPAHPLPWMPSQCRVASATWRVPPAFHSQGRVLKAPHQQLRRMLQEVLGGKRASPFPAEKNGLTLPWTCVYRFALQRGAVYRARQGLMVGNWNHQLRGCSSLFPMGVCGLQELCV